MVHWHHWRWQNVNDSDNIVSTAQRKQHACNVNVLDIHKTWQSGGRHCQPCRPKNSEHMSCVFKSIVSHSSWTAPPQTKLVSGLWQGVAILCVDSDQRALDLSLMSHTALHCLVCRGMVLQNNLTLTCHWDQRLARNYILTSLKLS